MVANREVRLFGIDAPELTQRCTRGGQQWACGSSAATQLKTLIGGRPVSCRGIDTDKHGRTVARCKVGGVDLNRTMVAIGYALAFRRYSMDYISAEQSAEASKRGIWAGTFDLPSDVRDAQNADEATPTDTTRASQPPIVTSIHSKPRPSGNCTIKGNRSRRGERIYHLPGMPYYAGTVAEEIFCTEAAARAAGYRRSRANR